MAVHPRSSGPFFVREAQVTYGPAKRPQLRHVGRAADIAPLVRSLVGDRLVEHFVAIALTSRNRPIGWTTISIGSMTACPVAPANVLRFALLSGGSVLIVAHNHPSGDVTPSVEDIVLTERLADAANLVGIKLLDHLIVGDGDNYFSFMDAGLTLGSGAKR